MLPSHPPIKNNTRDAFAAAIIYTAPSDAATAPTIVDAFDVTGDALRRIPEMTCIQAGSEA